MSKNSSNIESIEPIGEDLQRQVIERNTDVLHQAEQHYGRTFLEIPVLFDLRGRCSGMYRIKGKQKVIRYNPHIFAKYFADNLQTTIPHEVAHYVTDCLYGWRNIRPHGAEWRGVMAVLKADASRTGDYDLGGIPTRRLRYFDYGCGCQRHRLSIRRHNKLLRGEVVYHCRQCGDGLRFVTTCQGGA